jgi:hypothetical protein
MLLANTKITHYANIFNRPHLFTSEVIDNRNINNLSTEFVNNIFQVLLVIRSAPKIWAGNQIKIK